MSMTINQAWNIAEEAHRNQRDRDDKPHIEHVRRVVKMVPEWCRIVAILHDVVEDSDLWTTEGLRMMGLEPVQVVALELLTRREGEIYADYLDRLLSATGIPAALARRIKLADGMDNLRRCLETDDSGLSKRYRLVLSLVLPVIESDIRSGLVWRPVEEMV